jgi:hypothetical protein
LIFLDIHDFDILKSYLPIPMLPWHLHTFKGMMRISSGTNGTPMTKIFVGSMRSGGTVKSMTFDHPCKPSSLAEPSDIHRISGFEEIHVDFLT